MENKEMKEQQIVKAILDYLKLKKIFHWRNNTGALKTEAGGFMRFGATGSPDIFVVLPTLTVQQRLNADGTFGEEDHTFGQIIGLEVKNEKGKQSDNQLAWQKDFVAAGGEYHLVRSLDDVIKIL